MQQWGAGPPPACTAGRGRTPNRGTYSTSGAAFIRFLRSPAASREAGTSTYGSARTHCTREIARTLRVIPGEPATCALCGETYVPAQHWHRVCGRCKARCSWTAAHRSALDVVRGR